MHHFGLETVQKFNMECKIVEPLTFYFIEELLKCLVNEESLY